MEVLQKSAAEKIWQLLFNLLYVEAKTQQIPEHHQRRNLVIQD